MTYEYLGRFLAKEEDKGIRGSLSPLQELKSTNATKLVFQTIKQGTRRKCSSPQKDKGAKSPDNPHIIFTILK